MTQKVLVQLVDDLDGTNSQDVSTVLFGLDGVRYEIDLTDVNAERLRESIQEFVDSARRTGGRIKRGVRLSQSAKSAGSSDARKIRAWALENGYGFASRGRISSHVIEAYKVAHAKPRAKTTLERRTRAKKS